MTIEDLFNSFSGKEITVLLHRGNTGDGLIQEGMRTLLKKCGIIYKNISFPQDASGEILLISGCGAFSHNWYSGIKYVNKYSEHFEKVYVLPASYDVGSDVIMNFLAGLPKNVFVYCREIYSFDLVREIVPFQENVILDKDMAFHIDHKIWKRDGKGNLMSFRNDQEKCREIICRLKIMYQKMRALSLDDGVRIDVMKGSSNEWQAALERISKFREVHTDRVHVAIAAALLGKRTFIYPNSNHILKGVYEYSLASLDNVFWEGR